MFSNFTSFKDLDFENFNEHNSDLEGARSIIFSHYQGKQIVEPTAEGEIFGFEDFVMSKNIPVDFRNYEISFESTFMQEHENALKKQTKNFIESVFKFYEEKPISFQSEQIFNRKLEFTSLSAETNFLSKIFGLEQFLKVAQKQEKLSMFIDLLYKSYPKQFANEFFILASVAYNKHTETKNDQETQNDLYKKAKKLAETKFEELFIDQRIKFLNLKTVSTDELNCEIQVKAGFKSYIEFVFTTIMLISQEYFQNFYNENVEMKRERSLGFEDQQDNEYSSTQNMCQRMGKKRKH